MHQIARNIGIHRKKYTISKVDIGDGGEIKPHMLRFEKIETWRYPPWGPSTLGIFHPWGFFTPTDFSLLLIVRPGDFYITGHFTEKDL